MTTPAVTDYQIVQAMLKFGGSFARALGEAFTRADAVYFARLRGAFPDIWAEYEEYARLSAERERR